MGKAHKLTVLQIKNATKPGRLHDGQGLYLNVTPAGSKSWVYRYMIAGKDNSMGLGPYPEVTLAEARERSADYRKQIRTRRDPLAEKKANTATLKADQAKATTFDWCAEEFIKLNEPNWKNQKHINQWRNTLKTYASPTIGNMNVAKIETDHVLRIIEPIWNTKSETAERVRGRIESILGWATIKTYRSGDNPARWKDHLEHALPKRNKAASVVHHAALPYSQINTFMPELRQQAGLAARACEFAILTAARSSEVRGAVWSEFDLETAMWVVPKERIKMKKEHKVPLSKKAVQIIKDMEKIKSCDLVFPNIKGKPLSDTSLTAVFKRMRRTDITMHGFRSTFKDWASDVTDFPGEMSEMALAHSVSSAVEAAYRRSDMLRKRFKMMEAWSAFCALKIDTPKIA